MNNKRFENLAFDLTGPNQNMMMPPGIRKCGADQLNLKIKPIPLKKVNPTGNFQPQIPLQQNPNLNLVNNNLMPNNNFVPNNNINPYPSHQNIPRQWRDFY